MSTGPKFPLEWARRAAAWLPPFLGVDPANLAVVGSARRGKAEVGDLEFVAPMPAGGTDALYFTLQERLGVKPPAAGQTGGLFAGVAAAGKMGWAEKGFKPGFRHCSLICTFAGADEHQGRLMQLPVEIYRYDPPGAGIAGAEAGNGGWIALERTGPAEFGRAFLGHWARALRLPLGQHASVDGYLRDARGGPVGTATEAECFALAGLRYLEPGERTGPESVRAALNGAVAHAAGRGGAV